MEWSYIIIGLVVFFIVIVTVCGGIQETISLITPQQGGGTCIFGQGDCGPKKTEFLGLQSQPKKGICIFGQGDCGSTGQFEIQHESSGKCLSVASTDNNAPIVYATCDPARDKWEIGPNGSLKHVSSGKCIHPLGGEVLANDQHAVLHEGCGEDRLKFEWTPNGSLKHSRSGKCIHPKGGSPTPAEGTQAVYWGSCDEPRLRFVRANGSDSLGTTVTPMSTPPPAPQDIKIGLTNTVPRQEVMTVDNRTIPRQEVMTVANRIEQKIEDSGSGMSLNCQLKCTK
jgi:hypothetical protein